MGTQILLTTGDVAQGVVVLDEDGNNAFGTPSAGGASQTLVAGFDSAAPGLPIYQIWNFAVSPFAPSYVDGTGASITPVGVFLPASEYTLRQVLQALTGSDISEATTVIGALPAATAADQTVNWYVDIDGMAADIDASNWAPTGLKAGATVRLRKVDNSPHRVIFADLVTTYGFVDKRGEYVTLKWDGAAFQIN